MTRPFRWKLATGGFLTLMLIGLGIWRPMPLGSHRLVVASWVHHPYWLAGPEWNVYRVDVKGRPQMWHVLRWEVRPDERRIALQHWHMPTLADTPEMTYQGLWDGDRREMTGEEIRKSGPWPSAWALWVAIRLLPVGPVGASTHAVTGSYHVVQVRDDAGVWTVQVTDSTGGCSWTFRLTRVFPHRILEARMGEWSWHLIDSFRVPLLRASGPSRTF